MNAEKRSCDCFGKAGARHVHADWCASHQDAPPPPKAIDEYEDDDDFAHGPRCSVCGVSNQYQICARCQRVYAASQEDQGKHHPDCPRSVVTVLACRCAAIHEHRYA